MEKVIAVQGRTYEKKEELKRKGFKWNSILRAWVKVFETEKEAIEIAEEVLTMDSDFVVSVETLKNDIPVNEDGKRRYELERKIYELKQEKKKEEAEEIKKTIEKNEEIEKELIKKGFKRSAAVLVKNDITIRYNIKKDRWEAKKGNEDFSSERFQEIIKEA